MILRGEKKYIKMQSMIQTQTIMPTINPDGTYTLKVSYYELNEIVKGLKYMERQRNNARKYKSSKPLVLALNIELPVLTTQVPATQPLTLNVIQKH